MKKVIILGLMFVLSSSQIASAIGVGQYKNSSCGLADGIKINWGFKKEGKKFIEIKEECQDANYEKNYGKDPKKEGYNEYETYKRMLDEEIYF